MPLLAGPFCTTPTEFKHELVTFSRHQDTEISSDFTLPSPATQTVCYGSFFPCAYRFCTQHHHILILCHRFRVAV